jgi:rod shape-determining protein MreC
MSRLTRRQRAAAVVLAVAAVAFATLDLSGGSLRGAHSGMLGALGALYRGTDALVGPVRRFVQGIPSAGTAHARIANLQRENAQLRGRLAAASIDAATEQRLERLQLAAGSGGYHIRPARVIASGPAAGFDWTVSLDAGSAAGVAVGQTVTDGDGLVGRVLDVSQATCTVLLAGDPQSGIGVRDQRSGQLGLVTGHGAGGYTLAPLDPAADLRAGDELRTGPAGGTSYVPGLVVGTITTVRVSTDGTTSATVRPATSSTALDVVGVILSGPPPAPRSELTPTATAVPP